MRVVVATGNRGKLAEIRELLADLGIQLVPQDELGVAPAAETGKTFTENALIKARHAAAATGLPAIADDSGLLVDALEGHPGVRSARYAGPAADDRANVEKLLRELDGLPPARRGASFRCVAVFVRPLAGSAPVVAEGRWNGQIAEAPRGDGGFGYDPVFLDPARGRTAAEMSEAEKNALSHRGQAFRRLAELLREQHVAERIACAAPPLALYVHLPWCVSKCPYCDFNSHAAGAHADRDRYLDALVADLAGEAGRAAARPVGSVFLGGGTPSLFTPRQIGRLLEAIGARLAVTADAEVTMEANPGTVERGRLRDYRAAGVNRLSLGVQSFDDGALRRLGRIHGAAEAVAACREAQAAGFAAVNLDLMYALPGQTVAAALADLRQAVALGPAHLSWYELTLEPNTRFFASPPPDLPDEEEALAIERAGLAVLADAGYERYEISAFARPGLRCRHNLNYWSFGDYLGIGAGAHGKLTDPAGAVWRRVKPAHPRSYMERMEAGAPVPATRVAAADLAFEYMLNALRLLDGFSEAEFSARTRLPFAAVAPTVAEARENGLLERAGPGTWRPSARGFALLNDLQAAFLSHPAAAPQRPGPWQAQV